MSYMCHALTSSTVSLSEAEALLPPRSTTASLASTTLLPSICRRLYRLFAHAHHHHREEWQQWEQRRGTTARFLHLLRTFQLLPPQHLTPLIALTSVDAAAYSQ